MGLSLAVRSQTWAGSDMSWLASAEGTTANRSVTLDLSKFDFASTYTTKLIPSGTLLGIITASGKYGPYNDGLSTGVEVARGILFTDVDVTDLIASAGSTTLTGNVYAPMLIRGIVSQAKLPATSGVDAAGKTDLTFIQWLA